MPLGIKDKVPQRPIGDCDCLHAQGINQIQMWVSINVQLVTKYWGKLNEEKGGLERKKRRVKDLV